MYHIITKPTTLRGYQTNSRLPARCDRGSGARYSQGVIRVSLPGDAGPRDLEEFVLDHTAGSEVDRCVPQRVCGGVLGSV